MPNPMPTLSAARFSIYLSIYLLLQARDRGNGEERTGASRALGEGGVVRWLVSGMGGSDEMRARWFSHRKPETCPS